MATEVFGRKPQSGPSGWEETNPSPDRFGLQSANENGRGREPAAVNVQMLAQNQRVIVTFLSV